MEYTNELFLRTRYKTSPIGWGVLRDTFWMEPCNTKWEDIYVSQFCQPRRLYRLFGCKSETWGELIAKVDVLSRSSVAPAPSVD